MAKKLERRKAIELRKQGKSYSQIKKVLKVSKGTLSCWLRDYPLSKQRIRELCNQNEQRIERFRQTMRRKREKRWNEAFQKAKKELLPFYKKDLLIAGLFLYRGEVTKKMAENLYNANTKTENIKCIHYNFIRHYDMRDDFSSEGNIEFIKNRREFFKIQDTTLLDIKKHHLAIENPSD